MLKVLTSGRVLAGVEGRQTTQSPRSLAHLWEGCFGARLVCLQILCSKLLQAFKFNGLDPICPLSP